MQKVFEVSAELGKRLQGDVPDLVGELDRQAAINLATLGFDRGLRGNDRTVKNLDNDLRDIGNAVGHETPLTDTGRLVSKSLQRSIEGNESRFIGYCISGKTEEMRQALEQSPELLVTLREKPFYEAAEAALTYSVTISSYYDRHLRPEPMHFKVHKFCIKP